MTNKQKNHQLIILFPSFKQQHHIAFMFSIWHKMIIVVIFFNVPLFFLLFNNPHTHTPHPVSHRLNINLIFTKKNHWVVGGKFEQNYRSDVMQVKLENWSGINGMILNNLWHPKQQHTHTQILYHYEPIYFLELIINIYLFLKAFKQFYNWNVTPALILKHIHTHKQNNNKVYFLKLILLFPFVNNKKSIHSIQSPKQYWKSYFILNFIFCHYFCCCFVFHARKCNLLTKQNDK